MWKGVCDRFLKAPQENNDVIAQKGCRCERGQRTGREREQLYQHGTEYTSECFVPKYQTNVLPSKGSSTSSSICLSVPSFMSFSVKISDGTSSLTVSPSSSDFASHLSHGNVTVSEPWSTHDRGNLFKTTRTHARISPLKIL